MQAHIKHWFDHPLTKLLTGDSSFCISNGNSWTANIVRVRKTTSYKGMQRNTSADYSVVQQIVINVKFT